MTESNALTKALHWVRATRMRLEVYCYSYDLRDLNKVLGEVHSEFPCQAAFDAMALPHCDGEANHELLVLVESELVKVNG